MDYNAIQDINDILNKPIVNSTIGMRYSDRVIYENGAVKQVMFDGVMSPSTRRVCPDGTTSCATTRGVCAWSPTWGRAEQTNHYYPYELIHKPL